MKNKKINDSWKLLFASIFIAFILISCGPTAATYPQAKVEQAVKDICLKDYGISNVEVKIAGKTLGVHLPLKKLFENDVQNLLISGKVKDIESFLQLSEDAIQKIQDVIFTTSRVIMSSDKPIDFYVVKATDVDNTGLEFILANYVQDVKRVRFWDISLSEYYKRSYRDLKMNKSLFLKRPVLDLFRNVGKQNLVELLKRYFDDKSSLRDISPFFYAVLMEYSFKKDIKIDILNSKARIFQEDEILVYAKVKETYIPKPQYRDRHFIYPSGTVLEYLFILKADKGGNKIVKVLPFNYVAPDGAIKRIEFPETLKLYQSIESWPGDFEVDEIFLDEFLADQLNRRVQTLLSQDKKVLADFEEARVEFSYYPPLKGEGLVPVPDAPKEPRVFASILNLKPHKADMLQSPDLLENESLKYITTMVLKEFLEVSRGYRFDQYDFLGIKVANTPLEFKFTSQELEQFRKKKIQLAALLKRGMAV